MKKYFQLQTCRGCNEQRVFTRDGYCKECYQSTIDSDSLLSTLLAVIHGDAGHYENEVGTAQAVEDAIEKLHERNISVSSPRAGK